MAILPFSPKNQQQHWRDVRRIAQNRSETGLMLADRLASLAAAGNFARAAQNAEKLALCCEPRNIFIAADLHNRDTGECFDGCGALWACGLAYCPNCNAARGGRHRRRVRRSLSQMKPLVGLRWRFVTLTAPTQNAPLLVSLDAFLRGWDLLRKRKLFVENVWAGWRGIEFTATSAGNHAHIHALALSKFLPLADVRAAWSDCIAKAWSERDVSLSFNTHHGGAVVGISELRAVTGTPMERAILETCKYVCKADAWLSLSDSDLLAVGQCERFPRVFEAFGKARKWGGSTYLDTKDLNDGENVKLKSPEKLNVYQVRRLRKAHLKRAYLAAQFNTLDGREF